LFFVNMVVTRVSMHQSTPHDPPQAPFSCGPFFLKNRKRLYRNFFGSADTVAIISMRGVVRCTYGGGPDFAAPLPDLRPGPESHARLRGSWL